MTFSWHLQPNGGQFSEIVSIKDAKLLPSLSTIFTVAGGPSCTAYDGSLRATVNDSRASISASSFMSTSTDIGPDSPGRNVTLCDNSAKSALLAVPGIVFKLSKMKNNYYEILEDRGFITMSSNYILYKCKD